MKLRSLCKEGKIVVMTTMCFEMETLKLLQPHSHPQTPSLTGRMSHNHFHIPLIKLVTEKVILLCFKIMDFSLLSLCVLLFPSIQQQTENFLRLRLYLCDFSDGCGKKRGKFYAIFLFSSFSLSLVIPSTSHPPYG